MTRPTGVLPKTLICQGCRGRFELFIWARARLFCVRLATGCRERQKRGGSSPVSCRASRMGLRALWARSATRTTRTARAVIADGLTESRARW